MATQSYFTDVPKNEGYWRRAAAAARVLTKSLGSSGELRSGSHTTQKQFLQYRTLCPKIKDPRQFNRADFNLTGKLNQARANLAASIEFQNYLAAVGTNQLGNAIRFSTVLDQQMKVLNGLRHRRDPLKKHDEGVVNASIVAFLQAILNTPPAPASAPALAPTRRWRSSKISLTADFGAINQINQETNPASYRFTAITDGQLQDIATDRIEAILECKWRERRHHSPECDMQEISEVIALIKRFPDPHSPGEKHQRVTISQDGPELFISFHVYEDRWVDYLNGRRPNAYTDFMTTSRFGPWRIDSALDMEEFAVIALAVSL